MQRFRFGDKGVVGEFPEYDPEARKTLRQTFSTREGREALSIILTDLGFFDEARDLKTQQILTGEAAIRAQARRDYARRLLEMLGVLHEGNAYSLVDKLMDLPVWEEGKHRRQHGRSE